MSKKVVSNRSYSLLHNVLKVVAACSLDALGPDAVDGIETVNDSIADMNNSDDPHTP